MSLVLSACVGPDWKAPVDFKYVQINTGDYEIATWQKINNPKNKNIHIYIEGDGNAFNAYGYPTDDPTPRGTFVRNLVTKDNFENIVYMARPCQFVMNDKCNEADWTMGRFSQKIVTAQGRAIKQIAGNRKITLIGYSGGAMISGLIIEQNPKLKVDKWITVAGVLNHKKWTQYFGDKDLNESLNMEKLPNVNQVHFIGEHDDIVPYKLAKTWMAESDMKLIKNATHDDFDELNLFENKN